MELHRARLGRGGGPGRVRHHAGTLCMQRSVASSDCALLSRCAGVQAETRAACHALCVFFITDFCCCVVAWLAHTECSLFFALVYLYCACHLQLDAKDTEIQRLHDELQASKDYSQVCEDESVELRRQLFDMTKQMKKLNKELERLSVERATQPEQKKSAPASSKRSARKTTGDSAMATETETLSDAGSDSANSGGDHSMEDANAPRRSARRAGLRPEALSMTAVEAKPKRKASARTATASPDSERPAPASSKKKRVDAERAAATVSSVVIVCDISSADSEGDKELPKPVVREERALGESRQVTGGAGGMGEHPDPLTEEEQAPAAPPATESMQRELLNVLGEANLQLQVGWLPRMRALQQLKMLLTTPGMLKCDEAAYVEEMMRALVVQTSDARSQIVRESCGLITDIMPFLAAYHRQVADILLPQLWKLSYVSNPP